MNVLRSIQVIDTHTVGEPTRVVVGGIPSIPGKTMEERRRWLAENADDLRQFLLQEPRGHNDMFGAIVTFTTYIPAADPCLYQGDSNLWALYYETGSAFVDSVVGVDMTQTDPNDASNGTVLRKISLGAGLAMTPALHSGKEEGSKVFIQTSTGAVEILAQDNPGVFKSGQVSWRDE